MMGSKLRLTAMTIAIGLGSAAGAFAQTDHEPDIAHGKALVELNCSRCHAVGPTGESPHPPAPPFRTLSERYPVDALEEAFAEGIVTGHPEMPEFEATPEQIADIIAYLESIQPE